MELLIKNVYVQNEHIEKKKKTKPMKPKLLKTLNIHQLQASWSSDLICIVKT